MREHTSTSQNNADNQPQSTPSNPHSLRWRVADIAVGAALAAASGIVFWGFTQLSYGIFPAMTLLLPGSAALLHAFWYFPAPLAVLIIRKPGAAVYVMVAACAVEVLMGTKYSGSLFINATLQAVAAEIAFAIFRYRRYTLPVTILSGALIALAYNFYLLNFFYQSFEFFSPRGLIGTASELAGGVLVAGVVTWFLFVAVAKTGALDHFASGRAVRGTVDA